uniref:Uncharacterized protein n=1 Tax=Oryza meridionalis TaxID=40149 RepID=A0A0E0CW08_9ORYZ
MTFSFYIHTITLISIFDYPNTDMQFNFPRKKKIDRQFNFLLADITDGSSLQPSKSRQAAGIGSRFLRRPAMAEIAADEGLEIMVSAWVLEDEEITASMLNRSRCRRSVSWQKICMK